MIGAEVVTDGDFSYCLDFTRREEGGYSCLPEDSGNWSSGISGHGRLIGSNMGVSAPTLISWLGRENADAVTQDTMKSLPPSTYQAIARAHYWRSLGCDGLAPSVALMVFDFGWNVGIGKSARLLQTTLGLSGVAVDGDLGTRTQAIAAMPNWSRLLDGLHADSIRELQGRCQLDQDGICGARTVSALSDRGDLWPLAIALKLGQEQTTVYQGFTNFREFGAGWVSRTVRRVGAACAMALV